MLWRGGAWASGRDELGVDCEDHPSCQLDLGEGGACGRLVQRSEPGLRRAPTVLGLARPLTGCETGQDAHPHRASASHQRNGRNHGITSRRLLESGHSYYRYLQNERSEHQFKGAARKRLKTLKLSVLDKILCPRKRTGCHDRGSTLKARNAIGDSK